jgi:hypothetical protein
MGKCGTAKNDKKIAYCIESKADPGTWWLIIAARATSLIASISYI